MRKHSSERWDNLFKGCSKELRKVLEGGRDWTLVLSVLWTCYVDWYIEDSVFS